MGRKREMRRKAAWLLLPLQTARPQPVVLTRPSVWSRLPRRGARRVVSTSGLSAGLAKGTIMSSDSKRPVVFPHGRTMLVPAGQQYVDARARHPDGHEQNQKRHHTAHPEACVENATYFYTKVTPDIDKYVPSYLEAQPLDVSVGAMRNDGTYPPWVVEGDPRKTPCEQYVEWFNYIWNTGDPSQWGPTVFTNNCVTIDPSGMTTGAEESALNFTLLFRHFPELRGEVVSWGVNDRELFINWRFRIPNMVKGHLPIGPITQTLQEQQGGRDFLVPVIDKFCFVDGRVSFRAAYFDVITFVGYLSENFSANHLYDYLIGWTWKSLTSGGRPFLLKMLTNLFVGLFTWPPTPKETGLVAFAGDGVVTLQWPRVPEAEAYRLRRATAIEGPYDPLPLGAKPEEQKIAGITYTDRDVTDGTPYWYTVSPIYKSKMYADASGKERVGRRASVADSLEIAKQRRSAY
jgi:SnoaL-like domain